MFILVFERLSENSIHIYRYVYWNKQSIKIITAIFHVLICVFRKANVKMPLWQMLWVRFSLSIQNVGAVTVFFFCYLLARFSRDETQQAPNAQQTVYILSPSFAYTIIKIDRRAWLVYMRNPKTMLLFSIGPWWSRFFLLNSHTFVAYSWLFCSFPIFAVFLSLFFCWFGLK